MADNPDEILYFMDVSRYPFYNVAGEPAVEVIFYSPNNYYPSMFFEDLFACFDHPIFPFVGNFYPETNLEKFPSYFDHSPFLDDMAKYASLPDPYLNRKRFC